MFPSQEDVDTPTSSKQSRNDSKIPRGTRSNSTKTSETSDVFVIKPKEIKPIPHQRKLLRSQSNEITSDEVSEITSEYHESVLTSKSDVRSYRDKLKDRFKTVKQQTGKVLKKKEKRPFRSHANNIISLSRSVDALKRENVEIESQLRNYKRVESIEAAKESVSRTDKYLFFCETVDDTYLRSEIPHSEDLGELNASTQELIEDELRTNENCVLVENSRAENKSEDLLNNESDLLWIPPNKEIDASEKAGDEPHNIMNDGLYVPPKLNIPTRHLNVLEQRLFSDNDKRWFNSSGELEVCENPYSKISYRPDGYATPSNIETRFYKASKNIIEDMPLTYVSTSNHDTLRIDILSIKFQHHPLFSPEHVLKERLIKNYDSHREFIVSNKVDRLQKKIEALRKAKNNLKHNIEASGDNIDAELGKIQSYSKQITKVREEWFTESRLYRENIKSILHSWRAIKKIREINGFSTTSVKLIIRKEQIDHEKDVQEHTKLFEEIADDVISEEERKYDEKLKSYKKMMSKWKQKIKQGVDTEDSSPKPHKPTKSIDEEELRYGLQQKFKQCFKTPGEPILHFEMTYDNEVAKTTDDPKENLRRNILSSTKIYLKFFCNNIEICKSKSKVLTDTFVCHFEESFSVKLASIPDYVIVDIYEQPSSLMKRRIGEIKLKVPPKNIMTDHKVTEEHFTKNELVHYKHAGVGSGNKLSDIIESFNLNIKSDDVLNTSGFTSYSIAWNIQDFNVNVDNINCNINEQVLDENGHIDIEKLNDWIEKTQPDPQDPKNTVIFDYLKLHEKNEGHSVKRNYFRCDPYLYPLQICTRSELDDNIRFKLLELRDKNVPEFIDMVIPNQLKEIPSNVLLMYKRRMAEENFEEFLQEEEYEHDINSQRSYGRKYLRQMHNKMFQLCRNAENNLTFEDIVNEKPVPMIELFIKTMVYNFLNWFKLTPSISKPFSLSPARCIESGSAMTIGSTGASKILINIFSGTNIPVRRDIITRKRSLRSQSSNNTETEAIVKPFVEITYKNFKVITSISDGKNPIWNEEVKLSLEPLSTDYLSPNALCGSVSINLFDDWSDNENKANQWLGSIDIPICAVSQGKLEGAFLVQTPALLVGYEQAREIHHSSTTRLNQPSQSYANYTYINMSISIVPNIPKLSPDFQTLPSSEPPYLRDHIIDWNVKYNTDHPKRKFSALAIDSKGKTLCVTRYIKSLEPPQINADGFDVTPDQCARYISMIPFTDTNKFYQNMWLSTEELLKLGIGSIIDHAIALTCFFITLNLEAWLLLGYGIPHGSTAYVLVREYTSETLVPIHFIYDVVTGFKYNVMDPYCPLQKIFCVINDTNLWANGHRSDDVATTRFEFSRRFDWSPLFNRQVTTPTNSIQQKLIYISTYDTDKILASIDKKIKKTISKLRPHERTVWNHYTSNMLKNAMSKFEISVMHGKTSLVVPEIQDLAKSYKITGCSFNVPFKSINAIVERVVSAELHKVEESDVEFSCGVSVHPYPNQVLVVWIVFLRINKRF